MFIRAGFNRRFKPILAGIVQMPGYPAPQSAYLVRFIPSGDLAWLNRNAIAWGDRVGIVNRFEIDRGAEWFRASPVPA